MSSTNDGKSKAFGQGLPGTGGDIAPTDLDNDVEGHGAKSGNDFNPDAPRPGEGLRATPDDTDEQDVEGHLYRMGPTTEGEFSRRGPGENPHGDS